MGSHDSELFKEESLGFKRHLDLHNAELMPIEDDEIGICKDLSRIHIDKYKASFFDYSKVKSLFLGNISILGEKTQDYYKSKVPRVKIVKTSGFKSGNAEIVGFKGKQIMYISKQPFTDLDFVAVSHEYGHVPTLENPTKNDKEYFEYFETLPIFFEYLACKTIDKENAKELFSKIRLEIVKTEANFYLEFSRGIKNNGSYMDKAFEARKRDSYKYIKSLEYALQLIERFESDPTEVNRYLDELVYGNTSLKDIRSPLSIDTKNCKKVLKLALK